MELVQKQYHSHKPEAKYGHYLSHALRLMLQFYLSIIFIVPVLSL